MRKILPSLLLLVAACGGRAERTPDACNCAVDVPNPPPPGLTNPPPAQPPTNPPPPAPTGPAALLFSGDGPDFLSDVWSFDGTTWFQRTGTAPPSRVRHAMTGRAGNVVLFGGSHQFTQMLGDTWEWDGSTWHDHTSSSGPSAREDHAMASLGDVVVLYGGEGDGAAGAAAGNETWTWDGSQWTQRAIGAATYPGNRIGHAMAALNGKIVLFGGVGADDDTWELDPATWTWTRKTIPGPGDRAFFAMTTLNGKIVLFGGEKDANHYENDTWEYDGTSWTQRMVTGPSARFHHGMTTLGGRVILFSGEAPPPSSVPWPSDTWTWDGSAWAPSPSSGPEGRDVYTLAAP